MWLMRYWSAGDAKLITAFTALIPPSVYRHTTAQFPPIDMLLNIVLPIFAYLLIVLLIKTTAKQKWKVLRSAMDPRSLASSLLIIFSLSWIIREGFTRLNIQQNYFLYIILIAAIYKLLWMWLEEQAFAFMIFLSIMRLFLNTQYLISKDFIISFFIILTGYIIIMNFIGTLGKYFIKKVDIHRLAPGMVLTEAVTNEGMKIDPEVLMEKDMMLQPDWKGITEKEIKQLKNDHLLGKVHFNSIHVLQTIPFALFIFLGCILFILINTNILVFLLVMVS
ncbi:MAG: hypothetical protein ABIA62_05985 [Candidatus Woesearchaeota archaeon]